MTKKDYDDGEGHSVYGASGAHRWIRCPGSISKTKNIKSKAGIAAEQGTVAHELAESFLTLGAPCFELGQMVGKVEVDQEMFDRVLEYVAYVREIFSGDDRKENTTDDVNQIMLIETKVKYPSVHPEGFGTCDAIIFNRRTLELHIIDLKYGFGYVSAVDNYQLQLYAIGAIETLKLPTPSRITLHIAQPRLDSWSAWHISFEELKLFEEKARQAAENADSSNPRFTPGDDQCQWCKFKAKCPVLKKHTEESLSLQFEDLTEAPDVGELSDDQIAAILENKKAIAAYLKSIEEYAKERLSSGGVFPGYKMVKGRRKRVWSDFKGYEKVAQANGWRTHEDPEPMSPAKVEKAIGKDVFAEHAADFVGYKEGSAVMAPESDRREAIEMFEVLENE